MDTCEEYIVTPEQHMEAHREYWRQVNESEGFDVEHTQIEPYTWITGLLYFDCQSTYSNPAIVLVKRYAMLGLHHYNMLEGTNLHLVSLTKFNVTMNMVASYYITLIAHDSDPASQLHRPFQVRADEQRLGLLDLKISIARPKRQENDVTTNKPFISHYHGGALDICEFPDWPSDDDFNDGKRFYKLKQLEWQTTDWISLYLELVICATDRLIARESELHNVQILKVAIEATEDVEPPSDILKAKSVIVYITFKGLKKVPRIDEVDEDVKRRAIIRRLCARDLYIMGKIWSDKEISSVGEKADLID